MGFIRSRFLDDKAGVAAMLAAIKAIAVSGGAPTQRIYFHFSNYEEVGHGASAGVPGQVTELVAVDMAAVGEGQASDEFHATICVKDNGGPYHHGLSQKLRPGGQKQYPLQGRHLSLLCFRWRSLLARGRRRGRSVDRSRSRCFTQLRAHTYKGIASDSQMAASLPADGMTARPPQLTTSYYALLFLGISNNDFNIWSRTKQFGTPMD